MAVDQLLSQPWTRKHDEPGNPVVPSAPRTVFPKSLEELIEICTTRAPTEHLRAAGSHWALSNAAIADQVFVETHDPNDLFPAMGKTLFDVVPGCLNDKFIDVLVNKQQPPYDAIAFAGDPGFYLVHFEAGKRIYQLYAELDQGDDNNPDSLAVLLDEVHNNKTYRGPWAFPTLGGAGGQTVFGALTTGTHGGDFFEPPIADFVMALHLVADGGRHYWIEPQATPFDYPLTDDAKLNALFGQDKFKGNAASGADNFEIIRDNDVFNAVLVAAGRFGIVYSVVMRAVRQYTLQEERRLHIDFNPANPLSPTFITWQSIRDKINDTTSDLYRIEPPLKDPASGKEFMSRFLQIAVCVIPHDNFSKNLASVTKRWNVPMVVNPNTGEPAGRGERVGAMLEPFNAGIQGPRFEFAGNSHIYSPDPDSPGVAADASLLEQACANPNFLQGVIEAVIHEIEDFIASNGVEIGFGLGAVAAAGGGAILPWLAALLAILAILAAFLDLLAGESDPRLGQQLNNLKNELLSHGAAGLLAWQMIAFELFSSQQSNLNYSAISYAVMDKHDYFDQSCFVHPDSIEVFFDATDSMLLAFVDSLIAFEIGQEKQGKSFVGYIALRFTGPTGALLGEQVHGRTCAVEVAGLKDVGGVSELIDFAITQALNPNFHAILHWGQRNPSTRADIQARFGDTALAQSGDLHTWREALSTITEHGKLDGFSSAFTRAAGLEIVTPQVASLALVGAKPKAGQPITVAWDCDKNPPGTTVTLNVMGPNAQLTLPVPLVGQQQIPTTQAGNYHFNVVAAITLAGETRKTTKTLVVTVA